MSQINYAAMSDQELRRYFLQYRQDKQAFRAYLDRLSQRPRHIITTVDDPDFDQKVQAAILRKLQAENHKDHGFNNLCSDCLESQGE